MTDVLDHMTKAAEEMDADVTIWTNKILAGEMCYFMVNLWRIRFDGLSLSFARKFGCDDHSCAFRQTRI